MFLSIPMALLLTVAVPTARTGRQHEGHGNRPVPRRGSRRRRPYRPDEMGRPDLLPPRPRQAGRRRRSERRHEAIDGSVAALKAAGAKDLFLLFEPADIPGLPAAVVPLVDGADGKAIATVLSGSVRRNPVPMAGYRDDPRRRRCRHACRLGQHSQRRSPRLAPSCSPRWPRAVIPRSRSRSCRAPPCGGRSRNRWRCCPSSSAVVQSPRSPRD